MSRARDLRHLLIAAVLLGIALPAAGAAESAPVAVVTQTVDEVLAVLKEEGLSAEERRRRIEDIAHRRFDFDTMARLVVARYWKSFSPDQREAFVGEFTSFLARNYGDRIERYSDEDVEVLGEREESRGDVTVRTRIVGGNFEGAEVDYRLRSSDAGWRVIDVKVEGISLVLNYRDQFKAVLARGGAEKLLRKLREKNGEG